MRYALKSRADPEKKDNKRFFINEIIIACLMFFNAAIYPFLFDNIVLVPDRTHQIFTFVGLEAVINLAIWVILIPYWKIENYVFWKYIVKRPQRTYQEWKDKIRGRWKDSPLRDIVRKLIHFAFIPLVVIYWSKFRNGPPPGYEGSWTGIGLAVYYQANILYGFLIVMIMFDLIRLSQWKLFGMLPRFWAECTIKPSELNTFNSSSPMILSMLPFIYFGPQIFYCVVLIAPVSDAMASIIGKNFGKKRPGHNKTVAGFIAGAVTTYLLVILVHYMVPFENINLLEINILAIGAGLAFYLVDKYVITVTDNFANPAIVGITLVVLNAILVAI
jgi:dolichol kinase